MKNKKGFTLIELLSVIVILAIIALIAVPIILNIIDKSNKSALKDTAYGIISAGELYFSERQLELNGVTSNAEFVFPDDIGTLQVRGNVPDGTKLYVNKNGQIALSMSNGRYCIQKGYNDSDISIVEDSGECNTPGINVVDGTSQISFSNSNGENLVNYKIYGNSIQNGEPTPEKPIEVESVGEYDEATGKYKIPVKVRGKNLFDINNTFKGYHNGENEAILSSWGTSSHKIYVDGTSCYLSGDIEPSTICKWDKNGNFIQRIGFSSNMIDITGVGALAFDYYQVQDLSNKNIQLEYDTQTEYEPYIEPITTNIYLDEPLRKIGDSVDYIDFSNKKVVRNIGKLILNGSELWAKYSDLNVYYIQNSSLKYDKDIYCFSNIYMGRKSGTGVAYTTGNIWVQSSSLYPRIYIADDNYTTVESFSEYLNSNNVIGYFQLATPIEETIELPEIPTFEGTNIIELDTKIQPSAMRITYYTAK